MGFVKGEFVVGIVVSRPPRLPALLPRAPA